MNAPVERPATLLWITETFFPSTGGMAQSCDRIVHGLRVAGVHVDVLHLVPATATSEPLTIPHVTDRLNGRDIRWALDDDTSHGLNHLFAWLEADLSQKGHDYSHIVAFGGRHPLAAAPTFAAWLGAPLVTLLRGNDFDTGIFSNRHRACLLEALERSHTIGAVTQEKVDKVQALLPDANVHFTPNGIDLTDWKTLPSHHQTAADWKRTTGLEDRIVLGCFGHLKRKKGADLLIDCIQRSDCAAQIHLHLVGTIDPDVESRLQEDQFAFSISHTDFAPRSRLPAEYAKCDYIVIPSFYDGMPNVLLEAGGLGLPVIASNTGGMRDVLTDGAHGFLFHPGNADACCAALHRACSTDTPQRTKMGSTLQSHIASTCTAELETANYLSLFLQSSIINKSNA